MVPKAQAAPTILCNGDSAIESPRPGVAFYVSVTVCGTIDLSTGNFVTTYHSVFSSANSSDLKPLKSTYNYMACIGVGYIACVTGCNTTCQGVIKVVYSKTYRAGEGIFLSSSTTAKTFGPFRSNSEPNVAFTYIQVNYQDLLSNQKYSISTDMCVPAYTAFACAF